MQETDRIELVTSTPIERVEATAGGVTVVDAAGARHQGSALIGCDGVKSAVRQDLVGDAVRVSGHVVYRAVVDAAEFPADLRINAPVVWAGPNCHLVHYPLRGGEQFNLVVTFHSREPEEWGVKEGNAEEVQSYFHGISERPRQLLRLPRSWRRWATADREPTGGGPSGAARFYHAHGVERLVRNELWKGRTPERCYDALEWLYGWRVEHCLAA